jgi:hypothetical protein
MPSNYTTKHLAFLEELKQNLPDSSGAQRRIWAKRIVQEQQNLNQYFDLLKENYKVSSRFLWLLTDLAEEDKTALQPFLVELFERCLHLNIRNVEASFGNYWKICGIPVEKEGEYIDYLFKWLQSPKMNVTTKSRALTVLLELSQKHPDLRNELKITLEAQMDSNTDSFKKRVIKVLTAL